MAFQQTKARTDMPPVILQPGWYWYHYIKATHESAWNEFLKAHENVLKPRLFFRGDTARAIVVVFEIVDAPLAWTLEGIPSKAPKKGATRLKDLWTDDEAFKRNPDLVQLLAEMGETISNAVKDIGQVTKVLLWGGAAVVLFNLWQMTRPER